MSIFSFYFPASPSAIATLVPQCCKTKVDGPLSQAREEHNADFITSLNSGFRLLSMKKDGLRISRQNIVLRTSDYVKPRGSGLDVS